MQYRICRIITTLIILSLFSPMLLFAADPKADFYVSLAGNDSWSGKLSEPNSDKTDGPFATIEKARDSIRALKEAGQFPHTGITVCIRGGVYPLTKTFQLTVRDSGTGSGPIVYRAYRNEEVRLIGGKEVAGFKLIDDPAVLSRIDKVHRDKILQIDLKAQGITDFGELTPRGMGQPKYPAGLELFFQDKPMQLARWPNEGFVKIAGVTDEKPHAAHGLKGSKAGKFFYEGQRPQRWSDEKNIWLHGYWFWDWSESYQRVESIDTEKRLIILAPPQHRYGCRVGQRFYALNMLSELDQPCEWYLERRTGILYFWPPAPINEARVSVSILEGPMISMQDTSYITLNGLTLECTRGTAVKIAGGNHNIIAGCTLRNIGNIAVNINGGKENGVHSCEIYETGSGGIRLSGGDRKKLTPAGNYVRNNHIHHYSRWVRTYSPAVMINGVGNRVMHNLIHDAPHNAIQLYGNEHLIEFKEIHNVCFETGDVGAFYMGRDWTMRGNIIRHNYFHHIQGPHRGGAMAVYLDDCASGTTIFGNVFYKASRAAFIGGGRDNIVENNIFIECTPAVHIDARGLGWAKFWFDGRDSTLMDRLKAINPTQPPYNEHYPKLTTILEDDPAAPKGNVIQRNVCSDGKWLDLPGVDRKIVTIKNNLIEAEPGFVDMGKMNFQLRDNSPAYKLGFKRIPIEKIGLIKELPR